MAKILVVDDDAECLKLTSRILTLSGYQAVRAENGLEALDAMRRGPVDLILLDLMMPVMDGLTFLKTIRAEQAWQMVPVIVLSGIADMEMGRRVRESGVETYLVKSRYTIDELLGEIKRQITQGAPQNPQANETPFATS
ncbi:MAG: response regulator receiver sensor signal transduction histidine kinase [Phycisphaerales bacterium]|nr:response regulator receiver sensor signal transduction histidine kinase [Phycisphaerales bacterium]MDB5303456.1 response regulator receiver sensor signal transduction histidine kinase [Phycisphaerales bacterium]